MERYKPFFIDAPQVFESFPELKQTDRDGVPILSGFINLLSEDGERLDRYQIEIHPSAEYPNSYPLVYETGVRIPNI